MQAEPLVIRTADACDARRVRAFLDHLSADSVYRRFFVGGRLPDSLVRRLVEVDHETREAAVLLAGDEVVGLANYALLAGVAGSVEVAVVIADEWQRRGAGRLLASYVSELAARRGAHTVHLSVQAGNTHVVRMIRSVWPDARPAIDGNVYEYDVPLAAG